MASLDGKRIAVLVTSGVEQTELTDPVDFFRRHGATVTIITPKPEELRDGVKSLKHDLCGDTLKANALLSEMNPENFDALYIPGGFSPDHLRLAPGAVDFVKAFAHKPLFALCHGPQLLVNAGLVKGVTLTSWPSLEIDLKNAGANWVNQTVAQDGHLITSRMPSDIPAFCAKIEQMLSGSADMGKAA